MTLVLGGTPVSKVMIIGQWSSNAFINHIRSQVIELFNREFLKKENDKQGRVLRGSDNGQPASTVGAGVAFKYNTSPLER